MSSSELLLPVNGESVTPTTVSPQTSHKILRSRVFLSLASLAVVVSCVTFFFVIGASKNSPMGVDDHENQPSSVEHDLSSVVYKTAEEVAALVQDAIVEGDNPLVYLGLGDWGRCGSTTTNPVTRARNCNVQRLMVPSMETWAAQLKAANRLNFILSVGDQFYDGPMPISGMTTGIPLPVTPEDLLASDNDPIWDLSFRHIYDRPTLRSTPWYSFQGNHDYGGALASQLNWGPRATTETRPTNDGFDGRWLAPDLNFTLKYPIGDGNMAAGNCAAMIFIDTCPLMATYRASTGDQTDPDRRATTALSRQVFIDQINKFSTDPTVGGGVSTWWQMRWLRDRITEASRACKVVIMGGHHGIYGSGQHTRSTRQTDLRVRLNFPKAFQWAGVDTYINGHDHYLEVAQAGGADGTLPNVGGTQYVTTGAGSNIRSNNIIIPQSKFLLQDNGFTIHSANTTHIMTTLVKYDGTIVYKLAQPTLPKLRDTNLPLPTDPGLQWLNPAF